MPDGLHFDINKVDKINIAILIFSLKAVFIHEKVIQDSFAIILFNFRQLPTPKNNRLNYEKNRY